MYLCLKQLIKFEILLKITYFKKIVKNIKKLKTNYWILSKFVQVFNSLSNCILNEIIDYVLRKICESLNKF